MDIFLSIKFNMFEEKNENGVDEENKNGAVVEMFEEIPSDPNRALILIVMSRF